MLPLALFGHGILQLLSGPVLGPASSLFVYGVLSAKQGAIGPAALDVPAPAEFDNGDGLRAMRRADVSFGTVDTDPKGPLPSYTYIQRSTSTIQCNQRLRRLCGAANHIASRLLVHFELQLTTRLSFFKQFIERCKSVK